MIHKNIANIKYIEPEIKESPVSISEIERANKLG